MCPLWSRRPAEQSPGTPARMNRSAKNSDDPGPVAPLHRNSLVFGSERGVTCEPFHGCAAIWMSFERRGDFSGLINKQRRLFHYHGPIGWQHLSRRSEAFHRALLDEFFKRSWLMFHAFICHLDDPQLAELATRDARARRVFARFIQSKVELFRGADETHRHRICVHPLQSRLRGHSRSQCAAELANNFQVLTSEDKVVVRDEENAPAIQLANLFLECLLTEWSGGRVHATQKLMTDLLAQHLGWDDLRADTHPEVLKFNIRAHFDRKVHRQRPFPTRRIRQESP